MVILGHISTSCRMGRRLLMRQWSETEANIAAENFRLSEPQKNNSKSLICFSIFLFGVILLGEKKRLIDFSTEWILL